MRQQGLYINFANQAQVVLYEYELKGQLSDGNWENSRPYEHWKPMCDATAVCIPNGQLGPNFRPMRRYNFANSGLVDAVGERMLYHVNMSLQHPEASAMMSSIKLDDASEIDNMIGYAARPDGKYWQEKLQKLMTVFGVSTPAQLKEEYQKFINRATYKKSDLMRDLKQMSAIVNQAV